MRLSRAPCRGRRYPEQSGQDLCRPNTCPKPCVGHFFLPTLQNVQDRPSDPIFHALYSQLFILTHFRPTMPAFLPKLVLIHIVFLKASFGSLLIEDTLLAVKFYNFLKNLGIYLLKADTSP